MHSRMDSQRVRDKAVLFALAVRALLHAMAVKDGTEEGKHAASLLVEALENAIPPAEGGPEEGKQP